LANNILILLLQVPGFKLQAETGYTKKADPDFHPFVYFIFHSALKTL
jgi:hypothetical protein